MIIAERVLNLRRGQDTIKIPVRIFTPKRMSDCAWICRYEIDWPEGQWSLDVGGIDSVQALMLAFYMIGSDIYTSNYHKSGNLCFDKAGDGYGFPVPTTLRDLLQGDDKTFF